MWTKEELAGKTIVGVKVKCPFVWLEVQGGGWIEIEVQGDCCSDAFIEAVSLHQNPTLTGELTEINFPAQGTVQEVDEITAVRFQCDMGGLVIVHRNSSNGYYGNFMSVNSRGEPPADSVSGNQWYRVNKKPSVNS